jgi:hypothetical protein
MSPFRVITVSTSLILLGFFLTNPAIEGARRSICEYRLKKLNLAAAEYAEMHARPPANLDALLLGNSQLGDKYDPWGKEFAYTIQAGRGQVASDSFLRSQIWSTLIFFTYILSLAGLCFAGWLCVKAASSRKPFWALCATATQCFLALCLWVFNIWGMLPESLAILLIATSCFIGIVLVGCSLIIWKESKMCLIPAFLATLYCAVSIKHILL